jgi:hypothetical protein
MAEDHGARKLLKELRPHALWEVLKFLMISILMPTLYVLLQKARHLTWDWWVFGILFLSSLLVLAIQLRVERKPQQWRPLPSFSPSPAIPLVASGIHLEILRMVIEEPVYVMMLSVHHILLRARATNRIDGEMTIVDWTLNVVIGDSSTQWEWKPVPQGRKLVRAHPDADGSRPSEEPVPFPDQAALRKGIPATGWLYFEHSDLHRTAAPHHAAFTLTARDSLGRTHEVNLPPFPYAIEWEITSKS